MKKFNTSPISGMLELLPGLQSEFNRLKAGIAATFAAHGFQNIETPTIERMEVLLAKAGGETEKQIYKVAKTTESTDEADQALRFDHTVPLARYVVEHTNDLTFPFKVSQVGRNFRGERPQKGRFREFYQCDIDVIGWQKLPIAYDAEIILTLTEALRVLPIERFVVRVSNRKLLNGLLIELGRETQATEICGIVDHAEKVPRETTVAALEAAGLSRHEITKVLEFVEIRGERAGVIEKLSRLEIANEIFREGIRELDSVLGLLEQNPCERVEVTADMMIVRGLDYYTGTVFETIAPEHREFGSVCSGGRYDNLAQNYTEQKLPGVGGSIGLTRLFDAMRDKKLVTASETRPVDICILPVTERENPAAMRLADDLRAQNRIVDVLLTDKKLGDKLKYAAKVARYAVVVGEDEAESQNWTIRDLETGEESPLEI